MPRRPTRWRSLLCAGVLAWFAGGALAAGVGAAPRAPGALPALDEAQAIRLAEDAVGRVVPDFELRDRNGKTLRLSRYRGKPLLVSFIYTGCFEICPAQTRSLHEAVKGLDNMLGEDQFNVVSIGFNQPFDDPSAMRAFASQHRINHQNWEFLSPRPNEVEALTRAFGFSWVATPAGFDHVLGVTVVDAEGRIHSQVMGDMLRADRLGTPLRRLLLYEQPQTVSGALDHLIERVRILCTVYDARTGEYRYDWKLILQLVSGLLFFLTMFIWLFGEWRRQRRQHRQTGLSCPATTHAVSGREG
ncbi:SCO family protein [Parapusillimonas granuli]|uniref:SCO family protein n=1 Tax=Parapusillimonas granuli TaxID=380911 RepID=A0A853FZ46_9BURK|nr:SCO family protein [Parapusillimonas granuli]MBB5215018.1 protein SCO1/2 [Parapusillimonas granuli]MEB2401128.1 SCO family protein [Alcaligenaceae bacterium]NYT49339.1 SCO family protein [Parapusillimonas granuli]